MARRFHLLFLILTCFSVGAEMLLAAPGLASMPTDQVHDCGSEDAKGPVEIDAGASDADDSPDAGEQAPSSVRVATIALEETWCHGRAGMRRHRWCGVDLN